MANLESASFSSGNLRATGSKFSTCVVLVPKGQEYQAIAQALNRPHANPVDIVAIPMGVAAVEAFLATWQPPPQARVLLMGLAGALVTTFQPGDVVVYQSCGQGKEVQACTGAWAEHLAEHLQAPLVQALTSPTVITTAATKQQLHAETGAAVVDMEALPIVTACLSQGVQVAVVRVISDGAAQDLPDLSQAIRPDGSLNAWQLGRSFIQNPGAAVHLIRGSLRGLKVLKAVAAKIFSEDSH